MKKQRLLGFLSDLSRAFLIPVYVLPLVGLTIAIGSAMKNPNVAEIIPFLDSPIFKTTGNILVMSVLSILINLHIIFAVGLSIGLAKTNKHLAGFNAAILYLVYLYTMNTYMSANGLLLQGKLMGTGQSMVLGLQVVDTGIFVGIIIGILNAFMHNKYSDKVIKGALSIYGESRLVLLYMIPVCIGLGILFTHIWPPVQQVIYGLGEVIRNSGHAGVGMYGFLERILIPTGLHHLLWVPFNFTELGGVKEINGIMVAGIENIFMAEMADPTITKLSSSVIYDARSLVKIFGLSGAALALYRCARPENKVKIKAILLPAILSSILVGVTEPIEFTFLFTAPLLFLVHSILTGIGMLVLSIFDITTIGKGGLIDFILYNIPLGITKTLWPWYIVVGLVQAVVYYFVFTFLITKLNLKTPGRANEEVKLYSKADYQQKKQNKDANEPVNENNTSANTIVEKIIAGLGGEQNIISVENCFTRLRVEVKDAQLVNESIINETDCAGIINRGNSLQIIYGTHVAQIRQDVKAQLQLA